MSGLPTNLERNYTWRRTASYGTQIINQVRDIMSDRTNASEMGRKKEDLRNIKEEKSIGPNGWFSIGVGRGGSGDWKEIRNRNICIGETIH